MVLGSGRDSRKRGEFLTGRSVGVDGGGGVSMEDLWRRESLRQSYRGVTKRDWEEMCFPLLSAPCPPPQPWRPRGPRLGGAAEKEGPERDGNDLLRSARYLNPVTETRNAHKA